MSSGRGFIGGGGIPDCNTCDGGDESELNERETFPPLTLPLAPRPLR